MGHATSQGESVHNIGCAKGRRGFRRRKLFAGYRFAKKLVGSAAVTTTRSPCLLTTAFLSSSLRARLAVLSLRGTVKPRAW